MRHVAEEEEMAHLRYLAEEEEMARRKAIKAKKARQIAEEERSRYYPEEEIMDKKSKQEMKQRMKHQVKCGTFIDPKYKKRLNSCGTKSTMNLYKPMNKKLNDLRNNHDEDVPKAIRDVYNESVPNFKNYTNYDECQHVQKGVSMNTCSKNFTVIGEESKPLDGKLHANDSCFDPYSNF
jgi:hypothetical protein